MNETIIQAEHNRTDTGDEELLIGTKYTLYESIGRKRERMEEMVNRDKNIVNRLNE